MGINREIQDSFFKTLEEILKRILRKEKIFLLGGFTSRIENIFIQGAM